MTSPQIPKPNIRSETIAGITTFFTMSYIVVVNPSILATEGTGMAFSAVLSHRGTAQRDLSVMFVLALVSIGLLMLEHARF